MLFLDLIVGGVSLLFTHYYDLIFAVYSLAAIYIQYADKGYYLESSGLIKAALFDLKKLDMLQTRCLKDPHQDLVSHYPCLMSFDQSPVSKESFLEYISKNVTMKIELKDDVSQKYVTNLFDTWVDKLVTNNVSLIEKPFKDGKTMTFKLKSGRVAYTLKKHFVGLNSVQRVYMDGMIYLGRFFNGSIFADVPSHLLSMEFIPENKIKKRIEEGNYYPIIFAKLLGNLTREESECILVDWFMFFSSNDILACGYYLDTNMFAIQAFGEDLWSIRDILLEQDELDEISIEMRTYNGKHKYKRSKV